MNQLQRISIDAQRTANRTGKPMAVFNLNLVGKALYVIREADSFGPNCRAAGPFNPLPND